MTSGDIISVLADGLLVTGDDGNDISVLSHGLFAGASTGGGVAYNWSAYAAAQARAARHAGAIPAARQQRKPVNEPQPERFVAEFAWGEPDCLLLLSPPASVSWRRGPVRKHWQTQAEPDVWGRGEWQAEASVLTLELVSQEAELRVCPVLTVEGFTDRTILPEYMRLKRLRDHEEALIVEGVL